MDMETKDLSFVDVPQLKQYVSKHSKQTVLANKAVKEYLANYDKWKEIVGYIISGEDGERLYGAALSSFSGHLYYSSLLSEDLVNLLRDEITEYEGKVRFMYEYKSALYSNLVACLHKLNIATDDELKVLLKKSLFYSVALSNHTSYQLECYAYRSVSKYLIDSFKSEKLSMSSPTTFNDPFDCPILELLNLYGDDISKLIREAYRECLKITCFVNNIKLEPLKDKNNNPVLDENGNLIRVSKHKNDPEEYRNELMWAHYAKNHTGVCIKYHFRNDITMFADGGKGQIAYFRDIEYTSKISKFAELSAINLAKAFFAKGKAWEYENELRLLAYDPKGSGDYASIDAKDSIAAVFFGLKCPTRRRARIMNILKTKKWVSEKHVFNETTHRTEEIREEHPVDFYQMEIDEKHFGKLKAVKILRH